MDDVFSVDVFQSVQQLIRQVLNQSLRKGSFPGKNRGSYETWGINYRFGGECQTLCVWLISRSKHTFLIGQIPIPQWPSPWRCWRCYPVDRSRNNVWCCHALDISVTVLPPAASYTPGNYLLGFNFQGRLSIWLSITSFKKSNVNSEYFSKELSYISGVLYISTQLNLFDGYFHLIGCYTMPYLATSSSAWG